MNPLARSFAMVIGLVLLVATTGSWGAPPNPTESDENQNTTGGMGALGNALSGDDGAFNNTAFGFNALNANTSGRSNTATGSRALVNNTLGGGNTAMGLEALAGNTTGGANTAVGVQALFNNTIGHGNTGIGVQALAHNTIGAQNTACGISALFNNTIGNSNTAVGEGALFSNTFGSFNTAIGVVALPINTTGSDNTALGSLALNLHGTGHDNTAVGSEALVFQTAGNNNIAIGSHAGLHLRTGDNNIFIGTAGVGDESQTIRIGEQHTRAFVAGISNATVSGVPVEVDIMTGQLGVAPSSARYKREIAPMGNRSEAVLHLRPVSFAYTEEAPGAMHYGLIAEEVATVYPELVIRTPTGDVRTVKYQELIPLLLHELQREHEQLTRLQKELAELRALVGSLGSPGTRSR